MNVTIFLIAAAIWFFVCLKLAVGILDIFVGVVMVAQECLSLAGRD